MQYIKQFVSVATLLAALGGLAACGSVSHDIARDGSTAGKLVWPAPNKATPMHKDGTWPTIASLRQIQSGMNKRQLIELIGPPHFTEGFWGVHEWNYVFHLRLPDSDEARICQYKVLFDHDQLARSFYWMPASCASLVQPVAATVAAAAPAVGHYTLKADALFAFDRADIDSIRPEGLVALNHIAGDLNAHAAQIASVSIKGYTDRLGGEPYNRALSQRRADAVRNYLVSHGVDASKISAEGLGSATPLVDCMNVGRRALVACLAPNRRVEVVTDWARQ